MRLYLAARYSRRLELCAYRAEAELLGHQVTSRWLDGLDSDLEATGEPLPLVTAQFHAYRDMEDIGLCEAFIAFNEPYGTPVRRGGRFVEYGYALACGKTLYCVGGAENIFYTLPGVRRYATWATCLEALPYIMESRA
jgi:hypothetical protein